jgi:hypothetical protein
VTVAVLVRPGAVICKLGVIQSHNLHKLDRLCSGDLKHSLMVVKFVTLFQSMSHTTRVVAYRYLSRLPPCLVHLPSSLFVHMGREILDDLRSNKPPALFLLVPASCLHTTENRIEKGWREGRADDDDVPFWP